MLLACVTSIPPRFEGLPQLVRDLQAQTRPPDAIHITLPRTWHRFDPVPLPALPDDVTVFQEGPDRGPIMKLLPSLSRFAGQDVQLVICDDDCRYGPDWLAALLAAARQCKTAAVTGAGFGLERLGQTGRERRRVAGLPVVDIAQGFSGLLVRPDMFAPDIHGPPPCAWSVDDIWISAMLAQGGAPIVEAPGARAQVTPLNRPGALQDARIDGMTRAQANAAVLAHVETHFGPWPKFGY